MTAPLRVVTWNVRLGVESSLARVAARLRAMAPDVVALQEVGRRWVMGEAGDQAATIARSAGLAHTHFFPALWTSPGRDLRGLAQRLWPLESLDRSPGTSHAEPSRRNTLPHYGVALLSRFPVGGCRRVPLPSEHDEPRVCGICRLAAPGGPIGVLVTHLSIHAEDRARQAARIAQLLANVDDPTLALGDLNDEDGAPALRPLWRALDDAGAHGPGSPGATYPSDSPTRRIDYVLFRGQWRVVAPARPVSSRASDHLPVLAVVEPPWNPKGARVRGRRERRRPRSGA